MKLEMLIDKLKHLLISAAIPTSIFYAITTFIVATCCMVVYRIFLKKQAPKDDQAQKDARTPIEEDSTKTDTALSTKETLELSWKFLYNIAETILNKFSKEDQKSLEQIGNTLFSKGMRYEHVIDLGLQPKKKVSRANMLRTTDEKG
jgi:flagellar biosynthesis/type III secretory pathway M-ring protein FliF/YscJ